VRRTHCKNGHSLEGAPIRPDNGQRICVPCDKAYKREYYLRNREKVIAASTRRNRERAPEIRAAKYGLTVDEMNALLAERDGRCATCAGPSEVIDHHHASGRVRQALCHTCNRVLGLVAEDAERLRALATYLEEHQ
jgi:hypothetical protein